MAEYIKREALIAKLKQMKLGEHGLAERLFADGVYAVIAAFPSADVAPVVHAEWVVCGDGDNVPWMCSHCGKTTAHKYKVIYGKYCPNCGAKMDGGADHEAD